MEFMAYLCMKLLDYERFTLIYSTQVADYLINLHSIYHIPQCGMDSVESGTAECRRGARLLGILSVPTVLFLWIVLCPAET